ncbi:MAG: ABC transporter ATP-binding protein [Anaerolineae bacterium]|nr:ABC transporter ATP-binding protein [Anaerolineae bacterium]
MLKLDKVSKVYRIGTFGSKELRAVNNVSFEVKEGEVVSLIGESGSGKSTIGKMILKLISISSGTISFQGRDITLAKGGELKEYYHHVQGVFQDPFSSYNPIFKADRIFSIVREEFFPQVKNVDWGRRVNDALEAVGLNPEHVLNKFPHQLSGGQLQRFLIARALLLESKFLVADEIISMLDASTRIDVLNLMADLKRTRGLSVLFVTHDLSLAHYFSERAIILYRGNVVEIGETAKIYENPLHPYTRMLMASVPRLDKKWTPGDVELSSQSRVSLQGCIFYDRCPLAGKNEDCKKQNPALVEPEAGHQVACCCLESVH